MPTQDLRDQLIFTLLKASGGDAVNADAVSRYLKDAMPAGGRATSGYLYENGPFSLIDDDIFSAVVTGGSPLMQWLPTRFINDRFDNVAHLEWIAPEGFNGAQTYAEYLANVDIDDCGYGPSTSWSGFAYQMTGGSFSWTTNMMKPYQDGGTKYYENSPMYTIRGQAGVVGNPLSSDREWAVARLFHVLEGHLDYVLKHGDRANSNMEWDGLDTIIRPGYVQSRRIGPGTPHWADPIVVNGVTLNDTADILKRVRQVVRRLRNRANSRNWQIQAQDMAILMPATMWDQLAEFIAMGAMYRYTNQFGFDGRQTFSDFRSEYRDTRAGGIGFGTIDVDGTPVPVLADPNMGMNVTIDPAGTPVPGVMGDIYVLTRRANGITLLEQQYVDWRNLDYPTMMEDIVDLEQGHVRAGWITESNKCFYYYAEMAGRMVSYFQPMQGVIRNVALETLDQNEMEAGMFYAPDFYAYGEGNQGGAGNDYLNPI